MRARDSLALALAGLLWGGPAAPRQIWLGPQASVPPSPFARAADFADMFRPDAPWQQAAAHTDVFKLYGGYLLQAPQAEVDAVVADLKRRRIAIGLEVGVINIRPKAPIPPCGGWGLVEGYGTPAQAQAIARKITAAGGTIDYLAMDEPLFYGHVFRGRPGGQPGCRSAIGEIARLALPTLEVYRQAFPGIVVGDIEPTDFAREPGWAADLADWAAAFRGGTGHALAFLQLDVPWHRPSPDGPRGNIADAVAVFREAAPLFAAVGFIYNGARDDSSDAAWMDDARAHVRTLEDDCGLRPGLAVFQSWTPRPTHAMPESSPDALTSLIPFYLRARGR